MVWTLLNMDTLFLCPSTHPQLLNIAPYRAIASSNTANTVLLFQYPDIRFPPTDFSPGGALGGFIILIVLKKAKIVSLNRRGACTLRR